MSIIKCKKNPKICISLHFDITKLNNKRYMAPVPKNAANFGLVDKLPFGPTRSLKSLNKLHKFIGSA